MIETQKLEIQNWTVRVRVPKGPGPFPVMLLLHGWQGDEDVMWIFANRLPEDVLLVAPRAPHPGPKGGYGWVYRPDAGFSSLDDFKPAVESLVDLLAMRPGAPNQDFSRVDLVGFSQGAALAYAFSVLHPGRVGAVAGLAGFPPKGIEALVGQRPLAGKSLFVGHGSKDQIVPVEMARQGVEILERAGAKVIYCEDDVGHKLGSRCFRALGEFFKNK